MSCFNGTYRNGWWGVRSLVCYNIQILITLELLGFPKIIVRNGLYLDSFQSGEEVEEGLD